MKKMSVESLSLAGTGTVLVLAVSATLIELHEAEPMSGLMLCLIATLAVATTLVFLRIRQLSAAHRSTTLALSVSRLRYAHLVETAHEGIWVLDSLGRTAYANQRLADMFGCTNAELASRSLPEHLGDNPAEVLNKLLKVGSVDAGRTYDLNYRRADKGLGWAIVSARPLADFDSDDARTLLMLTDITERKAAELALATAQVSLEVRIKLRTAELEEANAQLRAEIKVRETAERALAMSEQRLQDVISTLPVPLFIKDAQSRIIMMNRAAEDQWGIAFAEVSGTRASAWFPPEQMEGFIRDDKAAFAGRKLIVIEESAWNSTLKENRLIQTYKKPVYDSDGEAQHLICVSIDITDRKQAEGALKESFSNLRQLGEHLEAVKEEERKKFALNIHDELGQNLLALKMDIDMLHARVGDDHPQLKHRIGKVLETLDTTIRSVRSIMNELHPSTLELGLPAALEWLVGQFEQHSTIDCTLSVTGGDGPLPDVRVTEVIFRIVQESLLNIEEHAHAAMVDVLLAITPDLLTIVIVDDGVGMAPGDAGKTAAFGLRNIQERVDVFGGELVIDSRRGSGTTLSITIPLGAEH